MKGIIHTVIEDKEFKSLIDGVEIGLKEQLVAGLTGSSRTMLMAALYKKLNRSLCIITHNLLQAQKVYEDLVSLIGEQDVWLYPVNELIATEVGISSPELLAQRMEVMNRLSNNDSGIFVVPVSGLRRLLPSKQVWNSSMVTCSLGDEIDVHSFIEKLVKVGYRRTSMVEAPGEFAVRGGIIDFYPLTENLPIRIELFDTEVDSIRYFSTDDQRSLNKLTSIRFGPAIEYILTEDQLTVGIEKLQNQLALSLKEIKDEKRKLQLSTYVKEEIEQIQLEQKQDKVFKYYSLLQPNPASLLDYLPSKSIVILDEMARINETQEQLQHEEAEWYISLLEEGQIVQGLVFSHDFPSLIQKSNHSIVYLNLFLRHVPHTHPQNILNMSGKSMQDFHGQMELFKTEIARWQKAKYRIILLGASTERIEKLESVLNDYGVTDIVTHHDDVISTTSIQIMQGDLHAGFELPLQRLAVITEKELFNKKKIKRTQRKQKLTNAERIKSYSELKVGDYVVHVNHGIGRFYGIETLEIGGVHKDYLHVKYQGDDKLFVPVEQIDLIQKYVGSEGKEPKIYKLGGTEWKRVKSKVARCVEDIADDLIKLYAEREAAKGYAFSPDGIEQREFESSFPYRETEDQLRSIAEIKQDMEAERPMDRLLCGDVGYGKTEVAIRAAFKAIMDHKQVAFLVPTTILAQQHYETMRERFQDFPINVGILNRFRSKKQQTETIKGLKDGTIDIVVGTHRLLSKDIKYSELGLLIIDEEQRFGVTHKEKIKQLKTNIDVLTLTATPIPRTLHMSMLGVRDLSVIETPPENRFPVQTYVVENNGMLVREAIERELARDGQVFYLYNRVEDIERKAEEIAMLVPDARVTFAHGQMSEGELESTMLAFLDGQYDVLVSTTIIETGVDIPNVNTLIVHDADRMGLSQLYQLRGRVGRSNRVAYAYFTFKKDKALNEAAEKRLQAIKEFTELGSGFKIAMRDLSIRGAGNLLGAQQHGFIDSVGFDLYSQMLKEAIEARKGTFEERTFETEIDIDIDAYIPSLYISDSKQKIAMYKQIRSIKGIDDLQELQEELVDRFGDYPIEVSYLLKIAELKWYAQKEKIQLIKR
ncbi:MAG: transcription-repair coupling factor, partial [Bacillaceae bacterium]